jgi:peptidoglycan/xylan/chitin deacetylase (PgdA/CDA1 family)
VHGSIHELNSGLTPSVERELMARSADTLERITRARPVGVRTPSWDFSEATLPILKDLGFQYDSSLMMNRFQSLRPYTAPRDVLEIFRREFDGAYADGGISS